MTLLGFLLPPQQKITLQITVMLAICVFLNLCSNMTPTTSEAVPLLGRFFQTCMFLVAFSVVSTVLVLSLHFRTCESHAMGRITRALLLKWFPWLLFMSRPGDEITREQLKTALEKEKRKKSDVSIDKRMDKCFKLFSEDANDLDSTSAATILLMHCIYKDIKFITKRMGCSDKECAIEGDWQFAARVVDRLSFVIFTASISLATLYIMFSAPFLL